MISIIMPVYNEEAALPGTLDHLLGQTGTFEIIVVDGGSSDRTCSIVAAYPHVQLEHAPKGRASPMVLAPKCATLPA